MAGAIGKGDFVECVDASAFRGFSAGPSGLCVGAVYRVEAIVDVPTLGPGGVVLAGVVCPANLQGAYNPRRFRPIYRPKADLIDSLKQPAPEAVRELVGL